MISRVILNYTSTFSDNFHHSEILVHRRWCHFSEIYRPIFRIRSVCNWGVCIVPYPVLGVMRGYVPMRVCMHSYHILILILFLHYVLVSPCPLYLYSYCTLSRPVARYHAKFRNTRRGAVPADAPVILSRATRLRIQNSFKAVPQPADGTKKTCAHCSAAGSGLRLPSFDGTCKTVLHDSPPAPVLRVPLFDSQ